VTPGQRALVAGAGFVAGGINGIAGGGSLVSFPALLAVGQPALTANVTSTVGIWPGYLGGVLGFRTEVADQADRVRSLLPATLLGAAAGAVLLLTTSADAFEALTPFLILLACALFAAQPLLAKRVTRRAEAAEAAGEAPPTDRRLAVQAATAVAAVYGAYFGAGLGVVLLAVLGTLLPDRLVRTNGLRNFLSLATNTVAALLFVVKAPVAWGAAGLLAAASLAGGYAGARFSRKVPAPVLRSFVVVVGVVAAVRLLLS
jgi:uncharacterized membrane protein YfcA